MIIQALLWEGHRGYRSPNIYFRCGGIINVDDVIAFFSKCSSLEVAWLGYTESQKSKPGNFFIELQSERTDDKLIVQCSSINVADSE